LLSLQLWVSARGAGSFHSVQQPPHGSRYINCQILEAHRLITKSVAAGSAAYESLRRRRSSKKKKRHAILADELETSCHVSFRMYSVHVHAILEKIELDVSEQSRYLNCNWRLVNTVPVRFNCVHI
jgi:hypothetical protein